MPSGIREFWVAQPFAARLGSLQGGRCSYNWFTEGFDTRDLKEAKALLDELAS
jgi:hypothetical protein